MLSVAVALVDAIDVDEEGDARGDEFSRGKVDGERVRRAGDTDEGFDYAITVKCVVFWERLL